MKILFFSIFCTEIISKKSSGSWLTCVAYKRTDYATRIAHNQTTVQMLVLNRYLIWTALLPEKDSRKRIGDTQVPCVLRAVL